MKPEYVNTDLELRSRSNINALAQYLSGHLSMLHNGREGRNFLATFEVHYSRHDDNADNVANQFCTIIESLPPKHRLAWNKCFSRHFDLGFHSGTGNRFAVAVLHAVTIQRLAKLKIAVAISVYPLHQQ